MTNRLACLCLLAGITLAGQAAAAISATAESHPFTAVGLEDGRVEVRTPPRAKPILQFRSAPTPVRALRFLPSGLLVVTQLEHTTLADPRRGLVLKVMPGLFLGATPDMSSAILARPASPLTTVVIHDLTTLEVRWSWPSGLSFGVRDVQFSPDSRYLVIQFDSRAPRPDGSDPAQFVARSEKPRFRLLDLAERREEPAFRAHNFTVPGRFNGSAYELTNPSVHVDGRPYNEGVKFDLTHRRWQSL